LYTNVCLYVADVLYNRLIIVICQDDLIQKYVMS
jgi:hypothetical protein